MPSSTSDAGLARSLEGGFVGRHAEVGGVRLHYVEGGQGDPLVLLGGWPQTWWEFHKIMPGLAEHRRVIAVDLRGMGGSGAPAGGYDKKTIGRRRPRAGASSRPRQGGHRRARHER
ncbi:alpha/beta fold hydrolase [Actinomadura nitritigenes]|uniref:alpha/beta fold hydrolase n=1 Tax=Actinomadura nitritigenes TaxID=134602 RepID=UPI003D8F618E